MSENSSRTLDYDPTNPEAALAHFRKVADRTIEITKLTTKTKELAIARLTKRYRFRTWLFRLCRGDKVPDSFSMYHRLCRALEEAIREQDQLLARDREFLEMQRKHYAAHCGDGAPAQHDTQAVCG